MPYQPGPVGFMDRFHFVVEDTNGNFLTDDLIVQNAKVVRMLSGPSQIEFEVHPKEPSVQYNGGPIQFKTWGQWIHAIKKDQFGEDVIWASGLVRPSEINPETGILTLKAEGFSDYAKGIPWLENWNPIAVDPFEIVTRIWNHIQSYDHGNLGVTVYPTTSGTQMLPGFSFNNEQFVQEFFAIFIREMDRLDCGDYINKLARDIPFDYFEESSWNVGKTAINKKIRLGYPYGGVDQTDLVFRLGENVLSSTPKQEVEMNWFSDITMKGYFPGKQYSYTLANADPDRYRRCMDETDLNINSNERAKAWASRLLTRRQVPYYFEQILVDPYHPNAPFGTYDVGDVVRVVGYAPWHGYIDQKHKIMMIAWDEAQNRIQMRLLAEGAFTYDPIQYIPQ